MVRGWIFKKNSRQTFAFSRTNWTSSRISFCLEVEKIKQGVLQIKTKIFKRCKENAYWNICERNGVKEIKEIEETRKKDWTKFYTFICNSYLPISYSFIFDLFVFQYFAIPTLSSPVQKFGLHIFSIFTILIFASQHLISAITLAG